MENNVTRNIVILYWYLVILCIPDIGNGVLHCNKSDLVYQQGIGWFNKMIGSPMLKIGSGLWKEGCEIID